MEGMANAATPMPAPPSAPIIPTISEAATATNDVVHLVRLVKSMREMVSRIISPGNLYSKISEFLFLFNHMHEFLPFYLFI
jgi:hypothetical protein